MSWDNNNNCCCKAQLIAFDSPNLSISDGNVVSLSALLDNTDEQTLSLSGTDLAISNGNVVSLSALLDNTDEQTLSTTVVDSVTTEVSISNGNTVPILHPTPTTATIYSEAHVARSSNGTSQTYNRDLTITRTAVGRWTVTLATPHPDGENFHPTFAAEEQSGNRDLPSITVVQGTHNNATTFDIQITTGDNGGTADVYVDTPFSVGITRPITVITELS